MSNEKQLPENPNDVNPDKYLAGLYHQHRATILLEKLLPDL